MPENRFKRLSENQRQIIDQNANTAYKMRIIFEFDDARSLEMYRKRTFENTVFSDLKYRLLYFETFIHFVQY